MDLTSEKVQKKIQDLEKSWKEKCKEFEKMEISPSDAERFRAKFRSESRPILWSFSRHPERSDFQQKIDRIQQDIDVAITKGQIIFRENEAHRFSEKDGKIIGPVLSMATAFFYAVVAIITAIFHPNG